MENNFLDIIAAKDAELLIFLNSLGSEKWDLFWLTITNQFNWIPLFVIVLILIYLKFGLKKTIVTLIFIALFVAFSDQFTNLIKNTTQRLRPCNTEELQGYLRQFKYKPRGYSFWSGHAALSTTFTTFIIFLLRNRFKMIYILLVFPIVFGYSRVYLGVHYPGDITVGYFSGIAMGTMFYMLYRILYQKLFKETLV